MPSGAGIRSWAMRGGVLAFALAALAPAGCGRRSAVPVTVVGLTCATCGMEVRDPRYAAARIGSGKVRPFDSIECALRDSNTAATLYLSDYSSGTLHRGDSLVVVRAPGAIPSPMGAGLAAFLDKGRANRIAFARGGTVLPADRLRAAPEGTP